MSRRSSIDDDDPLAGAPDEVLAAFVALGGRAARLREARHVAPKNAAGHFAEAAKLTHAAPRPQNPLLNRKA
jgi:hypothetical protein